MRRSATVATPGSAGGDPMQSLCRGGGCHRADGAPNHGCTPNLPISGWLESSLCDLEHHGEMTDPPVGFPKGIGAPATRALAAAGYSELTQLDAVPATELQKLHGMGPRALRILQG